MVRLRCILRALCAVCLCGGAAGTDITFVGGAGQVGGSCALVESEGGKALVDCGAFYGDEAGPGNGNENDRFEFAPREIDAALITHAHGDHAGRVMQLVRSGFRGTIYMTGPTRELLDIAWRSQALYDDSYARDWEWSARAKTGTNRWITVHWRKECEWSRKIKRKNRRACRGTYRDLVGKIPRSSGCNTCAELDVADAMKHVRTVPYDDEVAVCGHKVVFRPVEHLPGSSAIYFYGGEKSFAFSGDLGTARSRLAHPIRPSSKVDAMFVECTYGDKPMGRAEDVEREYGRFSGVVSRAMEEGKMVWVPAFAMDRTQRVFLELIKCRVRPSVIYSLSPSGNAMTELYLRNPEWFPDGATKDWASFRSAAKAMKRRFNPRKDTRKAAALLSTSGMMDAGISYSLLDDLLPDTNVVVCLVGYQSPGTPGRQLMEGKKSISLDGGREIAVGAGVETFECFSGHGDARENDTWLGENLKSRIFLIHGDAEALRERKAGLEKRHGANVTIVEKRKKYSL
ncbi:MAG: MBL fold metallo-hydrolase [Kiritimatiellae bacterium]|nr:MBL fold metallo-hydrolase [Kiritimatiellia bacterium]